MSPGFGGHKKYHEDVSIPEYLPQNQATSSAAEGTGWDKVVRTFQETSGCGRMDHYEVLWKAAGVLRREQLHHGS